MRIGRRRSETRNHNIQRMESRSCYCRRFRLCRRPLYEEWRQAEDLTLESNYVAREQLETFHSTKIGESVKHRTLRDTFQIEPMNQNDIAPSPLLNIKMILHEFDARASLNNRST